MSNCSNMNSKKLIFDYYDSLINKIDIHTEQLLEKFTCTDKCDDHHGDDQNGRQASGRQACCQCAAMTSQPKEILMQRLADQRQDASQKERKNERRDHLK